ncbi:hypothetical protein B0H14DRAFT_3516736 [Mycena olivaceomarginata]|nr:hypothetical protein B0H14DRAFT_3516736 [Mycena olivaceomarginata]
MDAYELYFARRRSYYVPCAPRSFLKSSLSCSRVSGGGLSIGSHSLLEDKHNEGHGVGGENITNEVAPAGMPNTAEENATAIEAAQPANAGVLMRVRKACARAKKWLGRRFRR